MTKALLSLVVCLILLSTAACVRPDFDSARSAKARLTDPDVPSADRTELTAGNQAFAFDLYRILRQQDGNLFYSPHSISLALAMTYAGARGTTEQQMAGTLHFTLPQERLHPAVNALDLELATRGEDARGKDGEGFRLNIVNAVWGQKDYAFLDEYLDVIALNYGAGLRLLDFHNAPDPSRITINRWVAHQTEDRIVDLIPAGVIDPTTRLVLTNAIYFNAAWLETFDESRTHDKPFTLLSGESVDVPTMRQTENFGYTAGDGYQAIELLYDGHELSMVILLPDEGTFEAFEESLDTATANQALAGLQPRGVVLSMPKFEFDSAFSLSQALKTLGMPTAFNEGADFSGMTGDRDLLIADVIHKTFVSVDEEGTEAAAATAVIMAPTSNAPPEEPLDVKIDRPFIFLIRDRATGTILFVGRILNPTL